MLREGSEREILVQLAELPNEESVLGSRELTTREKTHSERLGLQVADLTNEQREQLGLTEKSGGVLVESVGAGPAREAGVTQGDVILMMNGDRIGNVQALEDQISELNDGQSVAILVHRRDSPIFLALRVPPDPDHE